MLADRLCQGVAHILASVESATINIDSAGASSAYCFDFHGYVPSDGTADHMEVHGVLQNTVPVTYPKAVYKVSPFPSTQQLFNETCSFSSELSFPISFCQ